mgnify:CR=1 FL=1
MKGEITAGIPDQYYDDTGRKKEEYIHNAQKIIERWSMK